MCIKKKLLEQCLSIVDSKIFIAESAMDAAQESANAEERSTAGDKHDTTRAMSHLEREMYAKQLNEALLLKKSLISLNLNQNSKVIETGSMVSTATATYFIAVGIGNVTMNGKNYLVISPISPIGQQLLGKKAGDSFDFQGKKQSILEVT